MIGLGIILGFIASNLAIIAVWGRCQYGSWRGWWRCQDPDQGR